MPKGMNTVHKLMPVQCTPNRFQNPKIQCILLLKNLRMVGMVAVLCGIMIRVAAKFTANLMSNSPLWWQHGWGE